MIEICYLLPKTNIGTLVVTLVAIVGLFLAKELNAYLSKKIPVPIPTELIAVSKQKMFKTLKLFPGGAKTSPFVFCLDNHRYDSLLAGEFIREVWNRCGGRDSLRVRRRLKKKTAKKNQFVLIIVSFVPIR